MQHVCMEGFTYLTNTKPTVAQPHVHGQQSSQGTPCLPAKAVNNSPRPELRTGTGNNTYTAVQQQYITNMHRRSKDERQRAPQLQADKISMAIADVPR